jgi:hypothetical protein
VSRRLPALLAVVAGAAAGAFFWRGRAGARRPHVDLYYEDGSMISLAPGSSEWERLHPLARDVLAAARG